MKAFRALMMVALVLGGLWVLGSRTYRSWTAPPSVSPNLFTERLGLAGEFCGPLPGGLEVGLKSLALWLESDPDRREILRGGSVPPERAMSLTSGYRIWSAHNQIPDPDGVGELRLVAYQSLVRLLKVFLGLLTLGFFVVSATLLGRKIVPVEDQPQKNSLNRVLGVFFAWLLIPYALHRLTWTTWTALEPFPRLLLGQMVSYLVAALLLGLFWRWKTWKPWRAVDWKLVGQVYFVILLLLPLVEMLTSRLTGQNPNVILSLAPVFGDRTLSEGVLLVLIALFLGPLVEELMFRGWLLLGLLGTYKRGVALGVSSLLFALCHGSILGFPIFFAFGLLTGWMTLRTGSLGSSLAFHVLWNATTLAFLAAAM